MMAKWKAWALLGVVAVHFLVAVALHRYRPEALAPRVFRQAVAQPDELLMLLEFPAPRKTASAEARPATSPAAPAASDSSPNPAAIRAGEFGPTAQSRPSAGSLDLHLPPPAELKFSRPGLLESRSAISYQGTRYERAWISEGNLTHVVARKSQLAGVLLSVMGALIEPCTESDRANYKRGCVQNQYVHEPEEFVE